MVIEAENYLSLHYQKERVSPPLRVGSRSLDLPDPQLCDSRLLSLLVHEDSLFMKEKPGRHIYAFSTIGVENQEAFPKNR